MATTLKVFELLDKEGPVLRKQLKKNSDYFRAGMEKLGFHLVPGNHPIIPVMLGDAQLATDMANRLL